MECTAENAHSDMVALARMMAPAALTLAICTHSQAQQTCPCLCFSTHKSGHNKL